MGPYETSLDPYITAEGKWVLMPHQGVNGSFGHINGLIVPYVISVG